MQPLKSVANSNQPRIVLQLAAFATGSCCVSIARFAQLFVDRRARASMTKMDDLWVHQGIPQPGANWGRILEDVREERIESVLKA